MKRLNQFINEYIVKKKLDKPIDSEDHYEYYPETKKELIKNIVEVFNSGKTNLNCIDTSKITDMSNLFDSSNYNKSLDNIDISKWNVSNVKYMQFMFDGYENFNCDLSNWDVSKVENMNYMFQYCKNFNCDLSKWDVKNVETMTEMFQNCEKFEGKGLENWDVSNIINMRDMFDGCTSLKNKPSWYKE